ncbi:hypothetical protein SLA2020_424230 [Shorea laevis]
MENYSYNSYPDSSNSSPRSREIEFENPPPWDEQSQNYKIKFMCSYGGKIHPRPNDNQLSYIGGETKILSVDRNIKFSSVISKLSALWGGESEVSFKYQLPDEDLDALISVTNDDDLEQMMLEYDRMYRASPKPARMRLFIFPVSEPNTSFSSDGGNSERERFVEALNSGPGQGTEKNPAIPPNNVDFLFGLEKGMAPPPPPIKFHNPVLDGVAPPPPPPSIAGAVGSDHYLNPVEVQKQLQEWQRLQIPEHEQQAMYLKKGDDFPNPMEVQRQLQELQRLQIRDQEQQAMYLKKGDDFRNPMEVQRQLQELQRLQIREQEQQAMYLKKCDDFPNPMEVQRHLQELQLQRLQIREQEQQAMYLKKSDENNSVPYAGEYYKLQEKATPVTLPMTVQQPVAAPPGYWPEKQIPAAVTAHPLEHPVYMVPAQLPGTVYHAPSPIPAPAPVPTSAPPPPMVRPLMSGQPAGQGYYTNVQRMPTEVYREHAVYNIAAAAPTHPTPMSAVQQQVVRPSGGVTEPGYHQVPAYERQVYYTAPGGGVVLPPQYQGVGVPVTGEMRAAAGEAKVATKISQ